MTISEGDFRHRQVPVGSASIHVVEGGNADAPPLVFLHGWPESAQSWEPLMSLGRRRARVIAIDLPGIGSSTGDATDGSKDQLAETVHEIITAMDLTNVTLIGHDIGGMIVYAYLRAHGDLTRAVIMDIVIPGVDPWDDFLRAPFLWHFALHSVAALPERLVQGRHKEYFDYFYDVLSADPTKLSRKARAAYVASYATDSALTAGFNWFRAFDHDALVDVGEPRLSETFDVGRNISTALLVAS